MKKLILTAMWLAASSSVARAAEPVLPSAEWQASAENVASRIDELIEYAKAYGDDDARLADAVGGLKEQAAAKKSAPAWTKKTSWIEGKGEGRIFFGVGVFSGLTSNRPLAFVVAENRARVEIAKLQNITIVRRSEANGWRTVTTTTSGALNNVVIVDWYTEGNAIYALAAYGKLVSLELDAPWIP